MIRFLIPVAFLFLAFSAPALPAQNGQGADVSTIESGTIFEFETDRGYQRMTFHGPDEGLFKFNLLFPTGQGRSIEIEGWMNSTGKTTRAVSGGHTIIFAPHDCTNTIGACEHFVIFGNMNSVKIGYFGTYFDDGVLMSTRQASDPEFASYVKKQCFILDDTGVGIVGYGMRANGEYFWVRRINSRYSDEIEAMMALVQARCTANPPTT